MGESVSLTSCGTVCQSVVAPMYRWGWSVLEYVNVFATWPTVLRGPQVQIGYLELEDRHDMG
jgi:hypothetical protein